MSLESKLAAIREGGAARIPADKLEIMHAETQALRDSGILEKTIQVGDSLPAFELNNENGEVVRSSDLLAQGPVVLTVFRGHW